MIFKHSAQKRGGFLRAAHDKAANHTSKKKEAKRLKLRYLILEKRSYWNMSI